MPSYHVDFEPSGQNGSAPHVAINDPATNVSQPLPCIVPSGTYTVAWILIGNPGASAPGLIEATSTAGSATVPACPIGFDNSGQPIRVAATAAHDFIYNYTLP
jgi:hypothetical protein